MALRKGSISLVQWAEQNGDWGQRVLKEFICSNNDIDPNTLASASNKQYKFKCIDCTNTYNAKLSHKTRNKSGCPYCSGRIIQNNSLLEWCNNNNKNILLEEYINANDNPSPDTVAYSSNKKYNFVCHICNSKYTSTLNNRTKNIRPTGCPYCYNISRKDKVRKGKTINGLNDLLTWCNNNGERGKRVLKQYLNANNDIPPQDIARGSSMKAKFKCIRCGNIWVSCVRDRTSKIEHDCPYCRVNCTSYSEQFLFEVFKQIYPQTLNRYKAPITYENINRRIEYDIVIQIDISTIVCIEFNPTKWHQYSEDITEYKKEVCNINNIRFIEIILDSYDELDEKFDKNVIIFKSYNNSKFHYQQLSRVADHILKSLGHSIKEIDIEKAKQRAFNTMHGIKNTED